MNVTVFSAEYLNSLVQQASTSIRRRQHRNIHTDYSDPCQRLFNAIEPESYMCPHSHDFAQGAETIIAVRGLLSLVTFDDDGDITRVHQFGAGRHADELLLPVGVEIPSGVWHTIVARETGSVVLEFKAGPFNPYAPKISALWAPVEGSTEAVDYFEKLLKEIERFETI